MLKTVDDTKKGQHKKKQRKGMKQETGQNSGVCELPICTEPRNE